jgi:hypothetical protein
MIASVAPEPMTLAINEAIKSSFQRILFYSNKNRSAA